MREPLDNLCRRQGVRGTLLLAPEGINGTIAGTEQSIAIVLEHICGLPDCADLEVILPRIEMIGSIDAAWEGKLLESAAAPL